MSQLTLSPRHLGRSLSSRWHSSLLPGITARPVAAVGAMVGIRHRPAEPAWSAVWTRRESVRRRRRRRWSQLVRWSSAIRSSLPVGPYTGDFTARISRISPAGVRSTVVDGLPSSQTSAALGSLISGVADVEFIGTIALRADRGCRVLARLCGDAQQHHPRGRGERGAGRRSRTSARTGRFTIRSLIPKTSDFEPDGTWYSMIAVRGDALRR